MCSCEACLTPLPTEDSSFSFSVISSSFSYVRMAWVQSTETDNAWLNICVCACSVTQSMAFSSKAAGGPGFLLRGDSAWPRDQTHLLRLSCAGKWLYYRSHGCCCSLTHPPLTLCDPIDCSRSLGPPVHYQLLELPAPINQWALWRWSITISSSVIPPPPAFSLSPALWLLPMSCLFASGGQSIWSFNHISSSMGMYLWLISLDGLGWIS